MRATTGALIVGVRRENELLEFDAQREFVVGDVVFLVGNGEAIRRAVDFF